MRRPLRLALLAALLALVALLPACGRQRAAAPVREAGLALAPATVEDVRAMVHAPGARATLVNVWASWCAPCREEMPALLDLARLRRAQGLRLVLISTDFDSVAARTFLARQGVDFRSYLKSGDDMDFINGLDPHWSGALPATFVYDARGRQVRFWEGAADRARFDRAIAEALSGGPAPR